MDLDHIVMRNNEDVLDLIETIKRKIIFCGSATLGNVEILEKISIDLPQIKHAVRGNSDLAVEIALLLGKLVKLSEFISLPWYKRLWYHHGKKFL